MVDHYHQPDPFRYSLSAFLQAARNVTFALQKELSGSSGFEEFWEERQTEMKADSDLRLLNDARVIVVHKGSLVPSSSMFIGHFKYGRPSLGFGHMPLHPMMESIAALAHARHHLQSWEHPHRLDSGEEFGLQRKWALREAPEKELVQFSITSLSRIGAVFSKAHDWAGFGPIEPGVCEHFNSVDYQNLRESEIFLEVEKAWDGPPAEELSPAKETLSLLAVPSESAEVLHQIPLGKSAKGWINTRPSKFWSRQFASMLVYSIGDEVITKDTSVFFRCADASISTLPDTPPEDAEE
jgi:hypothetical protein